ncbi:hypothetical protein FD755_009470, partial [Muntiacus reevesi]
ACENDPQCGGGMCCAVSIWVKSIRICTPLGKVGDSCHPMSHKPNPPGVPGCRCLALLGSSVHPHLAAVTWGPGCRVGAAWYVCAGGHVPGLVVCWR